MIVDIETTGLSAEKDRIIEIGILEFAVESEENPVIMGCYGALEDPNIPLSDEIQRITGLQDRWLAGRKIDWNFVKETFSRASIAIAHNAEFDRSFLMRRPEISDEVNAIHWACSLRHIDWKKRCIATRSLTYLAAEHGFLNPFAHRAVFDCATTFKLIAPYLGELIQKSYEKEFRIFAVNAPFEAKDDLKFRGYKWDQMMRVWSTVIPESALEAERKFLSEVVYKGISSHQEQSIS